MSQLAMASWSTGGPGVKFQSVIQSILRNWTLNMSVMGGKRPDEDVVLVFRPPENPAAQIAGITPFKSLRLRLDELLEWFKGLNVESIDLWIEGAWKAGNRTELFLSVEGKTGAKLTLRPYSMNRQFSGLPPNTETIQASEASNAAVKEIQELKEKLEKAAAQQKLSTVTALFSPSGGIERHVVSLINSAIGSIEMAAYEFTNPYIEKATLEALRRGVKVDVVLDKLTTLGRQAEVHDNLLAAGAEIRLISPERGAMHDKYIIVDGKSVESGSYNFIERAENTNFENANFVSDSALAQQYHSDFASIFNQAKPESRGIKRSFVRFFRHFARRPDIE